MVDIGQEGTPSLSDYFAEGSASVNLRPNLVPTPQGLAMTVAHAARLNIHQNQNETQVIGIAGSSYHQHETDQVFRSVAGHFIVLGNCPGMETVRIQSKSGAAIELGHDGDIKIATSKGLHLGISGDHHVVLQGDYALSTSGNFKIACGQFIVDCTDMITTVGGHKVENIHGDLNSKVGGDRHMVTQGDATHMNGGDYRDTTAGNYKSQVLGDRRFHTKGQNEMSSTGAMRVETSDEMHVTSVKDMMMGTQANHKIVAMANSDIQTAGQHTVSTKGKNVIQSEDDTQVLSGGDIEIGSQGTTNVLSDTDINLGASDNLTTAAGGAITHNAHGKHIIKAGDNAETHSGSTIREIATTLNAEVVTFLAPPPTPNSPSSPSQPAQPASPDAPELANTTVATPKTEVPDIADVHKQVGDATSTDYQWASLSNEATICESYRGEGGSGSNQIPDSVKNRMKEKGMDPDGYYAKNDAPEGGSDSSPSGGYNVNENASTNFVNPLG